MGAKLRDVCHADRDEDRGRFHVYMSIKSDEAKKERTEYAGLKKIRGHMEHMPADPAGKAGLGFD